VASLKTEPKKAATSKLRPCENAASATHGDPIDGIVRDIRELRAHVAMLARAVNLVLPRLEVVET
jgi:hypothetical protein